MYTVQMYTVKMHLHTSRDAAVQRLNSTTWDNTFDIKYGSLQTSMHTLSGKNYQSVEGFEPGISGQLSIYSVDHCANYHCYKLIVKLDHACLRLSRWHGHHQEIFQGGAWFSVKNTLTFWLSLGVINAKHLGYFTGEQHMTSSFSNSRGGRHSPASCPPPLLTPMHGDSIALCTTETQLYTFSLGIDCKVLVKVVGNR